MKLRERGIYCVDVYKEIPKKEKTAKIYYSQKQDGVHYGPKIRARVAKMATLAINEILDKGILNIE